MWITWPALASLREEATVGLLEPDHGGKSNLSIYPCTFGARSAGRLLKV
jgi:hypothetical protein